MPTPRAARHRTPHAHRPPPLPRSQNGYLADEAAVSIGALRTELADASAAIERVRELSEAGGDAAPAAGAPQAPQARTDGPTDARSSSGAG